MKCGLEIYVMCEIPNNVIQIVAFSRLFDGFSIGSIDLTQVVLSVDRGQAPSDYPEVTEFLVELGIDAISVTPDTLLKTTLDVLAVERLHDRRPRASTTLERKST